MKKDREVLLFSLFVLFIGTVLTFQIVPSTDTSYIVKLSNKTYENNTLYNPSNIIIVDNVTFSKISEGVNTILLIDDFKEKKTLISVIKNGKTYSLEPLPSEVETKVYSLKITYDNTGIYYRVENVDYDTIFVVILSSLITFMAIFIVLRSNFEGWTIVKKTILIMVPLLFFKPILTIVIDVTNSILNNYLLSVKVSLTVMYILIIFIYLIFVRNGKVKDSDNSDIQL